MLLFLLTTAHAAGLTCADVKGMLSAHVGADDVLAAMQTAGFEEADKACILALPMLPLKVWRYVSDETVTPSSTPRAVPSASAVKLPAEDCTSQRLAATLPQPGVALGLSALVGFGAGHFYAGRDAAGLGFVAADFAGAIVTSAGFLAEDPEIRAGAVGVGLSMLSFTRLIEIGTAPHAARVGGLARLNACGL